MIFSAPPSPRRAAPTPRRTLSLAALSAACLLGGCGLEVWPDREPATAENIRVDSLRFLPSGTRFALLDSAAPIAFLKYHAGYVCSEILDMRLDSIPSGAPPAFRPRTRIRLPAAPDCPVDTAGLDTAVTRVFTDADLARIVDPLAEPGDILRLANSSGVVTDSVRLVRGRFFLDSIAGLPAGVSNLFTAGHYSYQDTSGVNPHLLFLDSASTCTRLDWAEFERVGDSVKVRFRLMALDSAAAPDSCHGTHADSVFARPIPEPDSSEG